MTAATIRRIAAEVATLAQDDHPTPECLRSAADGLRLAARRLDAQAEMADEGIAA